MNHSNSLNNFAFRPFIHCQTSRSLSQTAWRQTKYARTPITQTNKQVWKKIHYSLLEKLKRFNSSCRCHSDIPPTGNRHSSSNRDRRLETVTTKANTDISRQRAACCTHQSRKIVYKKSFSQQPFRVHLRKKWVDYHVKYQLMLLILTGRQLTWQSGPLRCVMDGFPVSIVDRITSVNNRRRTTYKQGDSEMLPAIDRSLSVLWRTHKSTYRSPF